VMVAGPAAPAHPAVAAREDALTLVFGRGVDNAVWYRARDEATGASWQPWQSLGGLVTGTPYGQLMPDGRLAVFGRGIDGAVWTRTTWDAVTWEPWTSLGGYILDDPTVVFTPWATTSGEPDVMVVGRGLDEQVWVQSYAGTTGAWSGWQRPSPTNARLQARPYAWADFETESIYIAGSTPGPAPAPYGWTLVQQLSATGTYVTGVMIGGPGFPGPIHVDTPVVTNGFGSNGAGLPRDFVGFSRDRGQRLVAVAPPINGWQDLGGILTHAPQFGPTVAGVATALGRGVDGAAWWHAPRGWVALGGLVRESPFGADVGVSRHLLTARGVDDGAWLRWFDYDSASWGGWEGLGGVLRNPPSQLTVYEADDAEHAPERVRAVT